MNYRFSIAYDDRERLKPIFKKFGSSPFTRAIVVEQDILPDITSGEISRWDSSKYIKKVSSIGDRTLWCLTTQAIDILKREM